MFINATALVLAKNGYVQERCGKQGKTWRHHVSTQSDTSPSRLVTIHLDAESNLPYRPCSFGDTLYDIYMFHIVFSHMINLTLDSRRVSLVEVQSTIRVRKQLCIGRRCQLG